MATEKTDDNLRADFNHKTAVRANPHGVLAFQDVLEEAIKLFQEGPDDVSETVVVLGEIVEYSPHDPRMPLDAAG